MNVILPLVAMTATLLAAVTRYLPRSELRMGGLGPMATLAAAMWPDRAVRWPPGSPVAGPEPSPSAPMAPTLLTAPRASRVVRTERTPLGAVVELAIATSPGGGFRGVRHWVVDPALLQIELTADRLALQAALAALIRRAVLHSRDGDFITLRWSVTTERVAIVVEDEGDGLLDTDTVIDNSGENCDFGVNADRLCMARCPPKLGQVCEYDMGLNQAQRLVAVQGGDVRIEVAPGIGARAWLTLPRDRVLRDA